MPYDYNFAIYLGKYIITITVTVFACKMGIHASGFANLKRHNFDSILIALCISYILLN